MLILCISFLCILLSVHMCILLFTLFDLSFVAFPSVLWYCWLGLLTCKNRRPYNLYCVDADVKPCSINQLVWFGLVVILPNTNWSGVSGVYEMLGTALGFSVVKNNRKTYYCVLLFNFRWPHACWWYAHATIILLRLLIIMMIWCVTFSRFLVCVLSFSFDVFYFMSQCAYIMLN